MKLFLAGLVTALLVTGVHASDYTPTPGMSAAAAANGITIGTPTSTLKYNYSNSDVSITDWNAGNFDIDTHPEFVLEKATRDFANGISPSVVEEVQSSLLADIAANPDLFAAYLGYHEARSPAATLQSSSVLPPFSFKLMNLTGRYGQPIRALCQYSGSRDGLVVLLPGRAATLKSYMGLEQVVDYTNDEGYYFQRDLNMNVCSVETYSLPDIAVIRLGLSARGVQITSIMDFIAWAEGAMDAHPLFVGGVSNGGHLAEFVGVLDDRVDGVISSGASARFDWPYEPYSAVDLSAPQVAKEQDKPYATIDFLFRGPEIYKALYPKALIISVGTHDPNGSATDADKYDRIGDIIDHYSTSPDCLVVNVFAGEHGVNRDAEEAGVLDLIANCLN